MTPADTARSEFRARIEAPGHATDNARLAVAGLEEAFATGALVRTPALAAMLGDLDRALDPGAEDARLGGKSAEAARLIVRAIDRELGRQT